MLANQGQACELVSLLTVASAANTAAATGTGVDISKYEGDLMVTQAVGVITGTLDGKLQQCDDAGGTNAEDIAGATFAQVTTANDNPNVQKITVPAGSLTRSFLRYVGTIVTGPSLVGVVLHAHPKYTT
jgi:hypothetical protein